MTFWTDERIEELRSLVEAGELSFGTIGKRLCCTRNAAIGKSRRLGFRQMNGTPRRRGPNVKRPKMIPVKPPAPILVEPLPLTPLGSPDRPPNGLCQFPMGEVAKPGFAFCARPVGNRPYRRDAQPTYCQAHAELCYDGRPAKKHLESPWRAWNRP